MWQYSNELLSPTDSPISRRSGYSRQSELSVDCVAGFYDKWYRYSEQQYLWGAQAAINNGACIEVNRV